MIRGILGGLLGLVVVASCGAGNESKRTQEGADAATDAGDSSVRPKPKADGSVPLEMPDAALAATPDASVMDASVLQDASSAGLDAGPPQFDAAACGAASQACCAQNSCDENLACAGSACGCIQSVFGNTLVRADGFALEVVNATQTPVRDGTSGEALAAVVQARRSHAHGCALREDDSVWCWPTDMSSGNNGGVLGIGVAGGSYPTYSAQRVQVDPGMLAPPQYLTGVASLQESFSGYLSLTNCVTSQAGGIWCWGNATDGDLMQVDNLSAAFATPIDASVGVPIADAEQVAVGRRHACYVTDAGAVRCWGADIQGALGKGTNNESAVYPAEPLGLSSGVAQVVAGPDATCVLFGSGAAAGTVRCWGATAAGNIGIGPPAMNTDGCINFCKTTPTRVRTSATEFLDDVVDLIGGYQTNCALRADTSVWCWGALTASDVAVPLTVEGQPVTGVSFATLHRDELYYIRHDGSYHRVISGGRSALIEPNCGPLF